MYFFMVHYARAWRRVMIDIFRTPFLCFGRHTHVVGRCGPDDIHWWGVGGRSATWNAAWFVSARVFGKLIKPNCTSHILNVSLWCIWLIDVYPFANSQRLSFELGWLGRSLIALIVLLRCSIDYTHTLIVWSSKYAKFKTDNLVTTYRSWSRRVYKGCMLLVISSIENLRQRFHVLWIQINKKLCTIENHLQWRFEIKALPSGN